MPVKVSMKPNWSAEISKGLTAGLLGMVTDIHQRSTVLAPKDTRALVSSGKIEPITDGFKIKYGNARVPYARRRHFENRKNPQTKGYLVKAGDSVARGDKSKYFRGKV